MALPGRPLGLPRGLPRRAGKVMPDVWALLLRSCGRMLLSTSGGVDPAGIGDSGREATVGEQSLRG